MERSIRALEEEKLREHFLFLNGITLRTERNKLVEWLKTGTKGLCDKARIDQDMDMFGEPLSHSFSGKTPLCQS